MSNILFLNVFFFFYSRESSELLVLLPRLQHARTEGPRCEIHHFDKWHTLAHRIIHLRNENVSCIQAIKLINTLLVYPIFLYLKLFKTIVLLYDKIDTLSHINNALASDIYNLNNLNNLFFFCHWFQNCIATIFNYLLVFFILG